VDVRILGPLEIDGVPDLGGRRQRSVFAILLLAAGSAVSVEDLIDGVWGEEPPASGRHLVQVYVSALRAILQPVVSLRTQPPGYLLELDPERVDAVCFEQLVGEAREAGDPGEALVLYDKALGLWRGPVLAGLILCGAAAAAVRRLDSLRLTVIEERADAALASGRHRELVPELERLAAEEPLRERLAAQLMLALYRSGRQADALAAYRGLRRRFADELGVEPSPELRGLERAMLAHDESLTLPRPAAAVGSTAVRRRSRRPRIAGVVMLAAAAVVAAVWLTRPSAGVRLQPTSVALLADGHLTASERLPAPPETAGADADGLWVVAGATKLVRFSAAGRFVRSYRIGDHPRTLAVVPHMIWIATGFDGMLTRLSSATGRSSRIRPEPRSEGRLALTSGFGSLWVGSQDGILVRANPTSGHPTAQLRLPDLPEALAAGFRSIWVGSTARQELVRVDARTNSVSHRIPVGGFVAGLASGTRELWAVTPDSGRVWSIDPHRNAVTSTTAVPGQPNRIAVADGLVWVGSTSSATLIALSERTRQIVRTTQLPAAVAALIGDGPQLWIVLR
jgi:DNA-binding SARP family transcriptional activator